MGLFKLEKKEAIDVKWVAGIYWNIKILFYYVDDLILKQVNWRGGGVSIFGDIKKNWLDLDSVQHSVGDCCLCRGIGLCDLQYGLLNLVNLWFCDVGLMSEYVVSVLIPVIRQYFVASLTLSVASLASDLAGRNCCSEEVSLDSKTSVQSEKSWT